MPGAFLAHGLSISSFIPLPELRTLDREADVVVKAGDLAFFSASESVDGCLHATPDEALFLWEGAGRFLIRGGNEVIVDPVGDADERVLRLYLLGPVLGLLLQQRGRLVLHGSAVATASGVAAFLGESGAGKSTIAAGLHRRGYPAVADDLVSIDPAHEPPAIDPGFPLLKLWPDAAAGLGYDPLVMPILRPDAEKRALELHGDFPSAPLHPLRIYAITTGETNAIEPLTPRDGMIELMRHSYIAPILERMGAAPANMMQCAGLAARVPVLRLHVHRSITALPALLDLIEQDLGDPPR
ncbi:MAG: hypothetical protein JWQ98_3057 [Chlorobi bacterium]|nr:hypothetical protein [Chlorobiota bacterium]